MKSIKLSVILLALLLAAMAMVPMVSAMDNSVDISTPPAELFSQLIGQNITVGQYYEKISPDVLKKMPSSVKDKLYQTKMEWPAPLNAKKTLSSTARTGTVSSNADVRIASPNVDIMALCESGYGVSGRAVSYLSRTFTSPSGTIFPYLHDNSKLLKWNYGTSQWDYVTEKDHSSYLASYDGASGVSTVAAGTYTVYGEHDGLFPNPLDPPYVLYTQSPIFTVS